jgi:hypothetical protein
MPERTDENEESKKPTIGTNEVASVVANEALEVKREEGLGEEKVAVRAPPQKTIREDAAALSARVEKDSLWTIAAALATTSATQATVVGNAALARAWESVPSSARFFLVAFGSGFSSSAAFGAGLSSLSTPLPALLVSPEKWDSCLTNVLAAADRFAQQYSLVFFYYSLGSIAADVLCLVLLFAFVSTSPSARRRTRAEGVSPFWLSHYGFAVLVTLAAIPLGALDLLVPVAVLCWIPMPAAIAATIIGKLLRPYVVAFLLALGSTAPAARDFVAGVKSSQFGQLFAPVGLQDEQRASGNDTTLLYLFWAGVVTAVLLVVSNAFFRHCEGDDDDLIDEDE